MLLGLITPLVLLCIGTRVVQVTVDDYCDGNTKLEFCDSQAEDFKQDDNNCHVSLFTSYRWRKLPKIHSKNTKIGSLAYLCLLTISLSSDVESNPGPDYSYASCGEEVLDSDMAVECDNCCSWFYISCQSIAENTYHSLCLESSFSWTCLICSENNFSHSTNSTLTSITSENQFCVLESENSPPPVRPMKKSSAHGKTKKLLKVININCQSIVNKRAEFYALLDYHDPDIVIGTESWLSAKHLNSEFFP